MTDLALVAMSRTALPPALWAHDIRNLLATIGLHLDSLERLSGPHGAKAANAAHALIARAGGMCSAAVAAADGRRPRHPFDISATIRQVIDLMAPIRPEGFSINLASDGTHLVFGDHTELFRVFFNLLYNALAVARAGASCDGSISRSSAPEGPPLCGSPMMAAACRDKWRPGCFAARRKPAPCTGMASRSPAS
jgi:signal transduction histidine kinase